LSEGQSSVVPLSSSRRPRSSHTARRRLVRIAVDCYRVEAGSAGLQRATEGCESENEAVEEWLESDQVVASPSARRRLASRPLEPPKSTAQVHLASPDPAMAAPSPLQQSHRAPRSDAGSETEDDDDHLAASSSAQGSAQKDSTAVQTVASRLAELALIPEVDVDLEHLHALSPEVISKQATINIGASLSPFQVVPLGLCEVWRGRADPCAAREARTTRSRSSASLPRHHAASRRWLVQVERRIGASRMDSFAEREGRAGARGLSSGRRCSPAHARSRIASSRTMTSLS